MSGRDPSDLLRQIAAQGQALKTDQPGARESLIDLSYALANSLQKPSETIQRIGLVEPARAAALRVAYDVNLFSILKEEGGGKPNGVNVDVLAEKSGVDKVLLSRLLKHLVATGDIHEPSAHHFSPTPLTDAFTSHQYGDGIAYTYDVSGASFRALPSYLKSISYSHPTSLTSGPFQYAHSFPDRGFWEWLGEHPAAAGWFNNFMGGYRQGRVSWMDNKGQYDVTGRLNFTGTSVEGGEVYIVDVGGGQGHDLELFIMNWPKSSGRKTFINQDRKEVIDAITPTESNQGIQMMAHDFFTEQPVKGARAYHLHSVLHDWPDAECVTILKHLAQACKPGFSMILINDFIVPDAGAPWPVTAMDLQMFVLGAIKERTESDWRHLINSVGEGLKIVEIWNFGAGNEGLIECEVAGAS